LASSTLSTQGAVMSIEQAYVEGREGRCLPYMLCQGDKIALESEKIIETMGGPAE